MDIRAFPFRFSLFSTPDFYLSKTSTMAGPYTVHTSTLFDPKKRAFVSDVSITVDPTSGLILDRFQRSKGSLGDSVPVGDIDLRGKTVTPGLVDAHSHIFLHSYE